MVKMKMMLQTQNLCKYFRKQKAVNNVSLNIEKGLTLSAFEWEKERKTLIYGQVDYMYGEALYKPEMKEGNPIRLYSLDEITEIFCKLGLRICNSFADFSGKPSSDNDIQLMVYSIRE